MNFSKGGVMSVASFFIIVALMLPSFVFADTILAVDSFGSSDEENVPNWTDGAESGGSTTSDSYVTNDSENRSGSSTSHHARVRDGGHITRTISTVGYNTIVLKYYWRGDDDGNGSSDTLKVQWKNTASSTYSTLSTHTLDGNESWYSATTTLPASANNTSIDIRFWGDSNENDEEGRIDDVSLEGTPIDTVAPVVTITPSSQTLEATSPSGAVANFGSSATDTIDGSTTTLCSPITGSTFPLGATDVVCSSTDTSGNTGYATSTITVQDTTAPVITLTGAGSVGLEVGDSYTEDGATATDDVDTTLTVIVGGDVVNTAVPGIYVVTYNITDDSGNVATQVTRTVTVSDVEAPVIDVQSDVTVEADDASGAVVTYGAQTATDDVDGSISASCSPTSGSTFALGTTAVACTATDTSGNVGNGTAFSVIVEDTTIPTITLVDGDMTISFGSVFTDPGASASDTVDTSVLVVVAGDVVDTNTAGVYVITYDATDDSGNNAVQVTRTVTVTAPSGTGLRIPASCSLTLNTSSIALGSSATLSWNAMNVDSVSLNQGIGSVSVSGDMQVTPLQAGDTVYTLTALSVNGGTECNATLSVTGTGGDTNGGGEVLGAATSTVPTLTVQEETPSGPTCTPFFTTYMAMGRDNNVDEVKKLQVFLNAYLGISLPVTGVFGPLTRDAVIALQEKKASDILAPWGLTKGTGVVYKFTLYWLNLHINGSGCSVENLPKPTV